MAERQAVKVWVARVHGTSRPLPMQSNWLWLRKDGATVVDDQGKQGVRSHK